MGRRISAKQKKATPLVLDAGAVIALSKQDSRARRFLQRAKSLRTYVAVPSVVVAETVRGRGPRDALVERVLASIDEVVPAAESTARIAGGLLGAAHSDKTIDAIVMATAVELGNAAILTSDPQDMRILRPSGSGVRILSL